MIKLFKRSAKARIGLAENVEYEVRGSDGRLKQIFQDNKLATIAFKKGWLSPNWRESSYSWLIAPFLGHWSSKRVVANLVTDAGKAGVASRINGSGAAAAFTYIAMGTGSTAAAAGDTTLGAEIVTSGLERAAATASLVTVDVTNDGARLAKTFSCTGTLAVTESGIFNAASSGTLLARQVFSAINLVSGDSLTVTWTVDVD